MAGRVSQPMFGGGGRRVILADSLESPRIFLFTVVLLELAQQREDDR